MGFPEPTSSEWLLGSACADMEAGEGIFVDSADAAGNTVAACCGCLDVASVLVLLVPAPFRQICVDRYGSQSWCSARKAHIAHGANVRMSIRRDSHAGRKATVTPRRTINPGQGIG